MTDIQTTPPPPDPVLPPVARALEPPRARDEISKAVDRAYVALLLFQTRVGDIRLGHEAVNAFSDAQTALLAAGASAEDRPPVNPRAVPLTAAGERAPSAWRCASERTHIHSSEERALRCPRCSCTYCGEASEDGASHADCEKAHRAKDTAAYQARVALETARRVLVAKQVPVADYEGFVYWENHQGDAVGGEDGFFTSASAVDDYCARKGVDRPAWVWACYGRHVTLDAKDILSSALEQDEVHEGAEFGKAATEALETAIATWNDQHGGDVTSWPQDETRIVVFRPEAMAGELDAARLLIARSIRGATTAPAGATCGVCGAVGEHVAAITLHHSAITATYCTPCLVAGLDPYPCVVAVVALAMITTAEELDHLSDAWLDATLAHEGKTRAELWVDAVERRAALAPAGTSVP